jgi:3-methyl-2-oxobutanoate hydroxymethyltransferase
MRRHATELAQAGAAMLVLELMPSAVAAQVQADNPGLITIGIGAGPQTAGQVMVLHDMLGITRGKLPRFVRNFMAERGNVDEAIALYVSEVKAGGFPQEGLHTY